ncbi:hypothetical protein ACET3Z_015985 [Daucus carota]
MSKQENDGTKNSDSQNQTEGKFPKVPANLNEIEEKKITAEGKGSSALLYTWANRELEYITSTCEKLQVYDVVVLEELKLAVNKLQVIRDAITSDSSSAPSADDEAGDDIEKELRLFKKYIRKMKLPIPYKFDAKDLDKQLEELNKSATRTADEIALFMLQKQIPRLHLNPTFENSPAFRDFEVQYNALPNNLKLCLLCFSVFPARAIIKKRLMVYWWIAEGFIDQKGYAGNAKDLEQLGAEYFNELVKKDFIKPYHNKRRLEVETCKMPSFIRSAVISIAARAKFFDFHSTGRPEVNCRSSFRSALFSGIHGLESDFDFEKFHVVFNVCEDILDIKPEWIHRMKNVVVLYLGRWQSIGNHHIEVNEEKFLEALGDMKQLKLLSLQGISRIVALPDQVTKLENLTILDLRACHNLERIPREIGLLKSLTHLDLSECYLLENIPKGLSKLKNLLVLKGFAVVEPSKDSCNLKDLSKLLKLRKLSIFTGLKDFPKEDDLKAFQQLTALTKLKIVWGGKGRDDSNQPQNESTVGEKSENYQEVSMERQKPTLENKDNEGSTDPPAPETKPEHSVGSTEPDTLRAPEGDNRETPQDKTTLSSKGSTLQDMAKLPKLKDLKPNFCFGETTPHETGTKIAASDAMDSAAPVLVPQLPSEPAAEPGKVTGEATRPELPSTPESKVATAATEDTEKVPSSKMSNTNSSSRSAVLKSSSKQAKQKKWWNWIKRSPENGKKNGDSQHLPAQLQKLELQCFPNTKAPDWLHPTKLKNLEKLYIRGGQLSDLGGNTREWNGKVIPWEVKILRLKYITGLAMHWKEVDKLFPQLIFLEKVDCPQLTFFPCDEAGVWIKKDKVLE